jgi:hypothetical protein
MLFKKLAVVFMPCFFAAAALVGNPAGVSGAEDRPHLERALSVLHAASQAAINVSNLADKSAKSDLVKAYTFRPLLLLQLSPHRMPRPFRWVAR